MAKQAKKTAKRPYKRRQNAVNTPTTENTYALSVLFKHFLVEQKRIKEAELKAIDDELAKLK